jgi:hypothetical protein
MITSKYHHGQNIKRKTGEKAESFVKFIMNNHRHITTTDEHISLQLKEAF